MDSLQQAQQKIQSALAHLQKELSSIRAGRANPSLLEDIPVVAYGSRMKMMEVGTISAPQPSLLTIQVWDQSVVRDVEKAILEANLGLNPAVDGQTVRVPIPPLTAERRDEFIKLAHQKGEATKIEIRQVRADAKEELEQSEESGDMGEDELKRLEKNLQDLIDKANASVDELVESKEQELSQI